MIDAQTLAARGSPRSPKHSPNKLLLTALPSPRNSDLQALDIRSPKEGAPLQLQI
jgi:hypothetical protein